MDSETYSNDLEQDLNAAMLRERKLTDKIRELEADLREALTIIENLKMTWAVRCKHDCELWSLSSLERVDELVAKYGINPES